MRKENVNRILCINNKYLGDLIVTTPALRSLKNAYPEARLTIVVQSRFIDVLDSLNFIDRIIPYKKNINKNGFLKRLWYEISFIKSLRNEKPDLVVNFQAGDRYAFWSFISGAKWRVGQRKNGLEKLHNIEGEYREEEINYLDYYISLAEAAGGITHTNKTELKIPDSKKKIIEKKWTAWGIKEEDLVLTIIPGASRSDKMWSPELFRELIKKLEDLNLCKIIIVETPGTNIFTATILNEIHNSKLIYDIENDVLELASLISRSSVCLVHDSGPRHIAAALNVRTITLFPEDHLHIWNFYDPNYHKMIVGRKVTEIQNGKVVSYLGSIMIEDVFDRLTGEIKALKKDGRT